MAKLSKEYMTFYVQGRGEDVLDDRRKIDEEELADRVMAGEPIREVLTKVADDVAATLAHASEKKDWIAENRDEILEAGGDNEQAFSHYVQGRKDQYAMELEFDVVQELFDDEEDDEGGEEDESEDDEEEDPAGGVA